MTTIRGLVAMTAALLVAAVPTASGADAAPADPRPPGRVQDLHLERRVRSLDTSWDAVRGRNVRYVVQKSVDGEPWMRVAATRDTEFRVKGLPSREVRIRVRAVRNGIAGGWSTPRAMTPTNPIWMDRRFHTKPVGADLPTGRQCASRVRPAPEVKTRNTAYNMRRGSDPHDWAVGVDGDFTGTTDEILQWVACKWGMDEDLLRAQAMSESSWRQYAKGDYTTTRKKCHPRFRDERPCPMSHGIFQIAFHFHESAYEGLNAVRSTAYNADYNGWHLRRCYDGKDRWLNDYPRGRRYEAGDAFGCTGVWNAGRWYTADAKAYIKSVRRNLRDETWNDIGNYDSGDIVAPRAGDGVWNERPPR